MKAKGEAEFVIPSTYSTGGGDMDARRHAAQREHGHFPLLPVDVDKGNHEPDVLTRAVREFFGDVCTAIYSTALAKCDDRRWRIMIPLDRCLTFAEWHELGEAFAEFMNGRDIVADCCLHKAAQPAFLPNVPSERREDRTENRSFTTAI